MNLDKIRHRALLSWLSLAVLVVLVCVLGVLQYRWIGEISQIERQKLQDFLHTSLNEVSRDFNTELSNACSALMPTEQDVQELGRERAYELRYAQWKESASRAKLFSRIGLVAEQDGRLTLFLLNPDRGTFVASEWPAEWGEMRDRIASRLTRARDGVRGSREPRGPGGPPEAAGWLSGTPLSATGTLIAIPRFGVPPFGPPRFGPTTLGPTTLGDPRVRDLGRRAQAGPSRTGDRDGLVVEVDPIYVASAVLPELLARHLGGNFRSDYRISVFARGNPERTIYQSGSPSDASKTEQADASVTLFDVAPQPPRRGGDFRQGPDRPGRGGQGRGGPSGEGPGEPRGDPDRGPRPPGPGREGSDQARSFGPGPGPGGFGPGHDEFGPREGQGFPGDSGRGRWELSIRLNAGSLESVVTSARWRNVAISAAILLLMIVTGAGLVRLSRQAQRLALVEMEFVAGVSHELRTPLTVIRTAAFNLQGKLAANPGQVERYGRLIQEESEKLTAVVEQVMRFAGAKSGRVIQQCEPVSIESVIEDTLASSSELLDESQCQVEKRIQPGLPLVPADSVALRHALQNLIQNAVKYGVDRSKWIGIFASAVPGMGGTMIEIRVVDHGRGIPQQEQHHIFDAFFRGKRAVQDQIHGTGLGLHLVKKIVEAHGGAVSVESEPGVGSSFIVRIPASPTEQQVELKHSFS